MPSSKAVWTNYPEFFISKIYKLIKDNAANLYSNESLQSFLGVTDDDLKDFKKEKLPPVSWLTKLASTKEGVEILALFNKLHEEDLQKDKTPILKAKNRNGRKNRFQFSKKSTRKSSVNRISEEIDIKGYLSFLRLLHNEEVSDMNSHNVAAIPCPKARAKFLSGFQYRTGCLDSRSFNILVGAKRISAFEKTGIIHPEWDAIIETFEDGKQFRDRFIQNIPASSLKDSTRNSKANNRRNDMNRGIATTSAGKEKSNHQQNPYVPKNKAKDVIRKIIKVTSLKNQNDLARVMSVNPAAISLMKNRAMLLYLHKVDMAAGYFNSNRRDFYEAIGIEDFFVDSRDFLSSAPENAPDLRQCCKNNPVAFFVSIPAEESVSFENQDPDSLETEEALVPALDMEKEAMSSKSAAANPIFKDLLEDERTQIDKAIHIALFKAGQKSSEAPAKIFFLGYLMEDLTSFCLNFAETEKRVYFQKEDRRGFLVISHLPFF